MSHTESHVSYRISRTPERKREKRHKITYLCEDPGDNQIQNQQQTCPICLESYSLIKQLTFNCKHSFCPCVNNWIQNNDTCPYCRKTIITITTILINLDNPDNILT
jgi:hypothetical protein